MIGFDFSSSMALGFFLLSEILSLLIQVQTQDVRVQCSEQTNATICKATMTPDPEISGETNIALNTIKR